MVSDHQRTRTGADASGLRVAIISSRYHAAVVDRLARAAEEALLERGGAPDDIERFFAPGVFELPALAGEAARAGAWDAIVALGCVIKGQTRHDEVIAHAVAASLAALSARSGVPVGLGVLTVETFEQAEARAGGEQGNKGAEAMHAALDAALTIRAMRRAAAERGGARP